MPAADLARRVEELSAVIELIKTLTSTLELPEILHLVLGRIKALTRAEALSLLLYDSERDELVFAATETLRENVVARLRIPPGRGIASWVACTGKSQVVNDVSTDARFYPGIDRRAHFKTRNLLAVPVRRAGRIAGVIELANRYGASGFSAEDLAKVEALAGSLGPAFDLHTLPHDAPAMRELIGRIAATVPSEGVALILHDRAGRELVFNASRTLTSGTIDGMRLPCDQGIAGWVARHREAVRLEDATRDPRYYPGVEMQTHFRPRTMLCVPIVSKDRLLGVIQVINKFDGSGFTAEELALAQALADHAAIAIENASLYHQAEVASMTDDLTGLGNTRQFNRVLPDLVKRRHPLALVVLDLDNFKQVVDAYGHLVGSRTIGEVGRRIGRLIRPGDIAARFGGDEFVVVLPDTGVPEALALGESIRAAIEGLQGLEGEVADLSGVTASVGIAIYPEHATDADDLFRAADQAMYAVKRERKNGVALAQRLESIVA